MNIMGPVRVPPIMPITKSNWGNNSAMVTVNAIIIDRKIHRLMLKSARPLERTKKKQEEINRKMENYKAAAKSQCCNTVGIRTFGYAEKFLNILKQCRTANGMRQTQLYCHQQNCHIQQITFGQNLQHVCRCRYSIGVGDQNCCYHGQRTGRCVDEQ